METNQVNGDTEIVTSPAPSAPKSKTQRTYHIRSKSDKNDTYTVIVHKGSLFVHPAKFAEECNSVSFVVPEKGAHEITADDGASWVEIPDPRR